MKIRNYAILPLAASFSTCTCLVACNKEELTIDEIYRMLETPYKYTDIVKEDYWTDSPTVFFHDGKWYMTYIGFNDDEGKKGYESYIADSNDLIHWGNRTKIFDINPDPEIWDSNQVAGYMGFIKNDLFGDYSLQSINGKYYIPYLGGKEPGYETDPLSVGLAWVEEGKNLLDPTSYHKYDEPILSPFDDDVRQGEEKTLYKSNMFIDEAQTLGHKYVNFYNAKDNDDIESIFIAVSDDGVTWTRYGEQCVFKDEHAHNTGDPVVVKYKDTYIMFYYVLTNDKKRTYDNFAISKDLIHWTPWEGTPLIAPHWEWEDTYAHKPSIVYWKGVLYHFYCAVNSNNERFIAVATSKPI